MNAEAARKYIDDIFKYGEVKTTGDGVQKMMPPMSVFDTSRKEKKNIIINKFKAFHDKYRGM